MKTVEEIKEMIEEKKKTIEMLKENEKIKNQYNCYACDSCTGKEDYRNMKRHCENAIKTVHKYNNALKKIREIVKPIKDNTCFGMKCGAVDWILKEIDEVLKQK